eukprot:CAMPEP_0119322196 /NCGR_PEP_ID=MMETSP1333-20130426/57520_1 /TAXON_ID=418940 /ORGANISM="Scyphosphaera apsteinii, Strain RCC1455" /LENGTH=318 /DNA_ID=CAMNT_0007329359 /DNA_START=11 /DNA_END=967 /DNA_ORIENTATION=-
MDFWLVFALAATPTPSLRLNNGVEMPAIAAGTWEYDNTIAELSVTAALEAGFTHIDTAHDYCADGSTGYCASSGGSNQVGIAKAIARSGKPRHSLFITTKVPGCGTQGISRSMCGADSVAAADSNIEELGVDYVDLLLVHFPPPLGCGKMNCKIIQQQWHALTTAHLRTNKTRALGVSNFCISCLECLAATPNMSSVVPAVNQFKYHIGMGADPGGLVSFSKSKGIIPQAYSPLGDNTSELISGPLVRKLGAAHGKTGVQAALRWIWQHGVAVTTKSGKMSHLQEDADIFNFMLTAEEMANADKSKTPKGKPSFMCNS